MRQKCPRDFLFHQCSSICSGLGPWPARRATTRRASFKLVFATPAARCGNICSACVVHLSEGGDVGGSCWVFGDMMQGARVVLTKLWNLCSRRNSSGSLGPRSRSGLHGTAGAHEVAVHGVAQSHRLGANNGSEGGGSPKPMPPQPMGPKKQPFQTTRVVAGARGVAANHAAAATHAAVARA